MIPHYKLNTEQTVNLLKKQTNLETNISKSKLNKVNKLQKHYSEVTWTLVWTSFIYKIEKLTSEVKYFNVQNILINYIRNVYTLKWYIIA